MSYSSPPRFGPPSTPKSIKNLLLFLGIVPLFSGFFFVWSSFLGPQQLLSLSIWGINHFLIWQVVTYPFVLDILGGISLGFFIELFFSLYLTWVVGSSLYEYLGKKRFFQFYFGTIIITGLLLIPVMLLFNFPFPFSGPAPLLYALLILWTMINPELELMLFMTFPVKAKWLITIMLTVIFLVNLGQEAWVPATAYLVSSLSSYFFGTLICSLTSPFQFLHPIDSFFISFGQNQRSFKTKEPKEYSKAKVFDMQTGKALLNDDSFMDAMLEKISKSGEKSLSRKERKRMQQISLNKKL
jgi:hypothetical protein